MFWFLIALLLYPKSTILRLSFLDPKDLCLPNQFLRGSWQERSVSTYLMLNRIHPILERVKETLQSHEKLRSLIDLSGVNIGVHSNSRDWLFWMFMLSKINPLMNKSMLFWRDVWAVFSIFIKNSKNVIPKYKSIIAPHVSSTCIEYIRLYQNCTDKVVLIWSNVMLNIRNELDKTFVRTK